MSVPKWIARCGPAAAFLIALIAPLAFMAPRNVLSLQFLHDPDGTTARAAQELANYPRGNYWLALHAIEHGDPDAALGRLSEGSESGDPTALRLAAIAHQAAGDYIPAVEIWKKDGNRAALLQLASEAEAAEVTSAVVAARSAYWELEPCSTQTNRLFDLLRADAESQTAAENLLRRTLALCPQAAARPTWHLRLGALLESQQRWDDAISSYEALLQESPDNARGHLALGRVLYRAGRGAAAALAELARAVELNPEDGAVYSEMGRVYVQEGRLAETVTAYETAAERMPEAANVQYDLAQAYRLAERGPEAVTAIEKALRLEGGIPAYHRRAGQIYETFGQREKALAAYRAALALQPDDQMSLRAVERLTTP